MAMKNKPATTWETGASSRRRLIALVLVAFIAGRICSACQICMPFPKESLADRILAAEHLVLVRENPDRPHTLSATGILVGQSPPTLSEHFLDSSTRRWLELDPEHRLLHARLPGENDWRTLGRYDKNLAPVVNDILSNREVWKIEPEKRFAYFADFLGQEDPVLADLAHLEVARAPYPLIASYAKRLPRAKIREELGVVRRLEWQALYILMLAQSGHPEDQQLIREKLERNARWSFDLHTAAWATALVEIDGVKGVDRIAELYLAGAARNPEELAAIHAALRVHGDKGGGDLRNKVTATYPSLLERQPILAADLAEDLTRWQCYDHTAVFARFLQETSGDLSSAARVRNYLRAAESASEVHPSRETPGVAIPFAVVGGLLLVALGIPVLGRRGRPETTPVPPSATVRRHPLSFPKQPIHSNSSPMIKP